MPAVGRAHSAVRDMIQLAMEEGVGLFVLLFVLSVLANSRTASNSHYLQSWAFRVFGVKRLSMGCQCREWGTEINAPRKILQAVNSAQQSWEMLSSSSCLTLTLYQNCSTLSSWAPAFEHLSQTVTLLLLWAEGTKSWAGIWENHCLSNNHSITELVGRNHVQKRICS